MEKRNSSQTIIWRLPSQQGKKTVSREWHIHSFSYDCSPPPQLHNFTKLGALYSMLYWYRCSTSLRSSVMHQHFRNALPSQGEYLEGQKKDGQIPHPGITVLLPVAGLPASAVACRCMTRHVEDTNQNYKKAVVFQLVIGKTAGTVGSLVSRC